MTDPAGPRTVLVVDDEALLAMIIEDELRAAGFDVMLALAPYGLRGISAKHLSAVTVDLKLGGDIRGQDIIRSLRAQAPGLPIVVITGYSSDAPQANLRGLGGPMERLNKPTVCGAVADAVERLINDAAAGAKPPGNRRRSDVPM